MKNIQSVASRDFEKDLESNNKNNRIEINDHKMAKQCPICRSPMRRQGQLKIRNPLTGRDNMVQVYYCGRCGHKALG